MRKYAFNIFQEYSIILLSEEKSEKPHSTLDYGIKYTPRDER